MASAHSNILIVEANDDRGAVSGLMQHHIRWGNKRDEWPVLLQLANSADEVLNRVFLSTLIKSSGLRALGVMIDADDKPEARWHSVRDFCRSLKFDGIPEKMPCEGLILTSPDGIRFGAWIMPDNLSSGMLETFCAALVPDVNRPIWDHAQASVEKAVALGAGCRMVHRDKSIVHTWLAWQDPPGERMGVALTKKMLDPNAPFAVPFVNWFRTLYQV